MCNHTDVDRNLERKHGGLRKIDGRRKRNSMTQTLDMGSVEKERADLEHAGDVHIPPDLCLRSVIIKDLVSENRS